MKQFSELQNEFNQNERLSPDAMEDIKGGAYRDDKRRQRPGGGASTTSLFWDKSGGTTASPRTATSYYSSFRFSRESACQDGDRD